MHSLVGSTSAATWQQGDWLLSLLLAWQRRSLCIQLHFCVAAAGVEKLQRQVQCAKKNQGVTVKKQEKKIQKRPAATPTWLGGALLAFCLLWMFPPKVRCICSAAKLRVCLCFWVCVFVSICVCVRCLSILSAASPSSYSVFFSNNLSMCVLLFYIYVCTFEIYALPLRTPPFPCSVYFTKFSLKPATCEKLFARSCIWDATRSFSLLT